MALVSIPNTFTVGAVIIASQHNSNFSIIYNDYNGNITDANIASNAAISGSKITNIPNSSLASGVGTSANNILALNSSSKIPAVDGSLLTNIVAATNANQNGNQFGSWVSKSNGTTYQAATDGFVVGFGAVANGGSLAMYTDSSSSPTTQRVSIVVTFSGTLSAMMPVKKSDYWVANGSGETWTTLFFLPMGS